ncbi:chitobiase/beta-hexosaminidase C-terminal domain-containing protein [Sediminitomix flava]|uniref:Fn3 domain-containing protein n=1 Tax=Sediminitomix flava TaxID=379075 RepID=A0A315ZDW6_SEDFL|nr:chitobiase/beta-hexosaminidase C-terminal domain-containing protein [Sediminitomix flava]PWJ43018.1 Fn3 domain-containing protein [Sediminitomix flava]
MKYIHILLFSFLMSFSLSVVAQKKGQISSVELSIEEKKPYITTYKGLFYLRSISQNSFELGIKNAPLKETAPLLLLDFEEDIYSSSPFFGVSYLHFTSEDQKEETTAITTAQGGRIHKISKTKKQLPFNIQTTESIKNSEIEFVASEKLLKIKLTDELGDYFIVFSLPKKIATANFSDGKGQSSGTSLKGAQLSASFEFPQKKKKSLNIDIAVSTKSFEKAIAQLKNDVTAYSTDQLMLSSFSTWKLFGDEFEFQPNDELKMKFFNPLYLIYRNLSVEDGIYNPYALPTDCHSVALISLLNPSISTELASSIWANTAEKQELPSLPAQTLMAIHPSKDLELLAKVKTLYQNTTSFMPIQEAYQNYINASILAHLGERSSARSLYQEAFKFRRLMNDQHEAILDTNGKPLEKPEKLILPYDLMPEKGATSVASLYAEMEKGSFTSEEALQLSEVIGMYPILPTAQYYSISVPKLDVLKSENLQIKKDGSEKYIGELKLNGELQTNAYIQIKKPDTSLEIMTNAEAKELKLVPSFTERTSFNYEAKTFMPFTLSDTDSFEDKLKIDLSCNDEGAEMYYTVDGSEPSLDSRKYTIPFFITKDCTLKVKAIKNGMSWSDTLEKQYTRTDK